MKLFIMRAINILLYYNISTVYFTHIKCQIFFRM